MTAEEAIKASKVDEALAILRDQVRKAPMAQVRHHTEIGVASDELSRLILGRKFQALRKIARLRKTAAARFIPQRSNR